MIQTLLASGSGTALTLPHRVGVKTVLVRGCKPEHVHHRSVQLTEACQRGPCGLSAAAGAVEERYEREGANVQTHHLLMAGNPALSHWYKLEDVK